MGMMETFGLASLAVGDDQQVGGQITQLKARGARNGPEKDTHDFKQIQLINGPLVYGDNMEEKKKIQP